MQRSEIDEVVNSQRSTLLSTPARVACAVVGAAATAAGGLSVFWTSNQAGSTTLLILGGLGLLLAVLGRMPMRVQWGDKSVLFGEVEKISRRQFETEDRLDAVEQRLEVPPLSYRLESVAFGLRGLISDPDPTDACDQILQDVDDMKWIGVVVLPEILRPGVDEPDVRRRLRALKGRLAEEVEPQLTGALVLLASPVTEAFQRTFDELLDPEIRTRVRVVADLDRKTANEIGPLVAEAVNGLGVRASWSEGYE